MVTPVSHPRLIICLPSAAKLSSFWEDSLRWEQKENWSLCFDEVGQTRGMSSSKDVLDLKHINMLDICPSALVQAAPHVLRME